MSSCLARLCGREPIELNDFEEAETVVGFCLGVGIISLLVDVRVT